MKTIGLFCPDPDKQPQEVFDWVRRICDRDGSFTNAPIDAFQLFSPATGMRFDRIVVLRPLDEVVRPSLVSDECGLAEVDL